MTRSWLRTTREALAGALALLMSAGPLAPLARAEPVLQEVVRGEVSVEVAPVEAAEAAEGVAAAFQVNATNGSIGRYRSFDVDVAERVTVTIDAHGGSHLAQVTSADPTHVLGRLISNGHVYLVNPAGVYFGATALVDVVGLHAAAGDVDVEKFDARLSTAGEDRYTGLEGTVSNLGRINAAVVDLVGQHVVNAGIIEPGSAAADGYFVLVSGDDVTISRREVDGGLEVSVTIEGLAADVIDRMGTRSQPGVEIDLTGEGRIDAGGGEIFVGARVGAELGAGDLVGAAIRYVGRTDPDGAPVPDTLAADRVTFASDGFFLATEDGETAIAGAADVEVDGGIAAGEVLLCAGTPCYDATGLAALAETGSIAQPRAEVRLGPGARLAGDGDLTDGDLTLIQDADLQVGAELAAALAGGAGAVTLQGSDSVDVSAGLAAQSLDLRAGADGSGDLRVEAVTLAAGSISLRAGDGATLSDEPAAVRIAEAAAFRGEDGSGAPDVLAVRQDADLGAASLVAATQLGDGALQYSLRSDEGDIDLGADLARKLDDPAGARNAAWDLELVAAGNLSVEGDLRAASLKLAAGEATSGAELRVGSDSTRVTLAADTLSLRAGRADGASGSSRVVLTGDPRLLSTDGSAATRSLALEQDDGIGRDAEGEDAPIQGRLPGPESFAPEGVSVEDALASGIDLTLRSRGGALGLDADDLATLAPLFARADLELDALLVELGDSVAARSLRVESAVASRVGGSLRATEGDVELVGPLAFSASTDQAVVSEAGRVLFRSIRDVTGGAAVLDPVAKRGGGSLRLEAGAPDAPDARPLELEVDLSVEGGDLEIASAFSSVGSLEVLASDAVGGGLELAHSGRLDGQFLEVVGEEGEPRPRDQRLRAERLVVASGVELVKTTGGRLTLEGMDSVAIDGTVRVENSAGTKGPEGDLAASELVVSSGERVRVGKGERASLAADAVTLRAVGGSATPAVVEVGDVAFAAPDGSGVESLLVEQEATLASEALPAGTAFAAGSPQAYTVRSTQSAITVDAGLAGRLGGLDTDLTIDAARELRVLAGLDSRALTLRAGHASAPPDPELVVGSEQTPVTLRADSLLLHTRGDGVLDLDHATLLDQAGARAPLALTLRSEAAFDSADDVPDPSVLGAIPDAERMSYTLRSDGGGVSVDAALAARLESPDHDLTLVTAGDVTLSADLRAATLSAHAGTDGDGSVRIVAPATGAAPELTAESFELRAGDGGASVEPGAIAAVEIDAEARLLSAAGGAPARFALEQDDALVDADIPESAVFGGSVDGMEYALRSHGALSVSTRDKILGTALTLAGVEGVELDLGDGEPLELSSLAVESLGVGAPLALAQSVAVADADIAIATDLELRSASLELSAERGDVALEGAVTSPAGSALRLAAGGDVSAAGAIRTGGAERAGSLTVAAATASVGDVATRRSDGSGAGAITLLADSRLRLDGSTDATSPAGDAGDVRLSAGAGVIELGPGTGGVHVAGRDVAFESEVTRAPEVGDPVFHELDVVASGGALFSGDVTIDTLTVSAAGDVELGGDVETRRVATGVTPSGPSFQGGVVELAAGTDGSGRVILSGVATLAADRVSLAAGAAEPGLPELDLGSARLVALDGGAPLDTELRQAATLQGAGTLLSHLGETPGGELAGRGVGLHSEAGEVRIDAADLAALRGTHLTLGGRDGVVVEGSLEVASLDLDSDAEVRGDLSARAPLALAAAGDLRVQGDLALLGQGLFEGSGAQTVDVAGRLTAPRLTQPLGTEPGALTLRAAGGLDLVGSADPTRGGRLVSVDAEAGLLFIDGDVTLAGDLRATGDLSLSGSRVSLVGVGAQALRSSAGIVSSEVGLEKRAGRRPGDASLELGGRGFDVNGDVVAVDDLTLVGSRTLRVDAAGDTRLLEAETGTLELVGGSDDPGANAGVSLELRAGAEIRVEGDVELAAREATFAAAVGGSGSLAVDVTAAGEQGRIRLLDDVRLGSGGALALHAAALEGIELAKDPGAAQRLEAGSIALNPAGRAPAPRATIARRGDLELVARSGDVTLGTGEKLTVVGDLHIEASQTARLSDLGALTIAVDARRIEVPGRAPGPVERRDGSEILDGGTDIVGNRVRFSTEPVTSGAGAAVATPGAVEISDSIASSGLLVRAIRQDGRALQASDLDPGDRVLDAVALGPSRFDSALQLQVPAEPVEPLPLIELAGQNAAAVGARPLWADELVAYLESAALGAGGRGRDPEPRLQTEPVASALRLYVSLLAPTALFDEETGGRVVRSHHSRIRDAFARAAEDLRRRQPGAELTGPAFSAYLESDRAHSEALFYLSSLGDLAAHARRAGVADHEIGLFKRLLVRQLAPEGLRVEELAAAIP